MQCLQTYSLKPPSGLEVLCEPVCPYITSHDTRPNQGLLILFQLRPSFLFFTVLWQAVPQELVYMLLLFYYHSLVTWQVQFGAVPLLSSLGDSAIHPFYTHGL